MSVYSMVGLTVVGVGILWSGAAYLAVRTLEEPTFVIVEKKKGYEIRKYDSYLIATTKVQGTYQRSLNDGFSAIAGYIFGGNVAKESIAMTAPVQESVSEKIAMTVPVMEEGDSTERYISFTMPKKYTLATLPKPNNPAVELREIPVRTVAVLSFSWWATEGRVESKKQELLAALSRDSVSTRGPVQAAYYNPPFTPPFMQRHEVMVEVVLP